MLRALQKSVFAAVLLMLLSGQTVSAEVKVYQYDGKLPFVQMMLNMMVAMGILDRLPVNGAYGGYGLSGFSSPWSSMSNPYARALAMRGINPGGLNSAYGGNPFQRSPWLQSPWSSSGVNSASPVWGNPGWGVLPLDSYTTNNYAAYDPALSSVWSESDLDGWVNEPWETSSWNPKAEQGAGSAPQPTQQPAAQPAPQNTQQSMPPLVQNFTYNVPGNPAGNRQPGSRQDPRQGPSQGPPQGNNHRSPLAKLAPPDRRPAMSPNMSSGRPPAYAQRPAADPQRRQSPLQKKTKPYYGQKPCVTDFCGLKKPDLNGLWVAQDGEMLGIKNKRYLWSDNNSRYLTGQLQIQNEYLLANVDGHEKLMRFKYKLAGNHLLTLQPDGTMREFVRMPVNSYQGQYQGQYQNQNQAGNW